MSDNRNGEPQWSPLADAIIGNDDHDIASKKISGDPNERVVGRSLLDWAAAANNAPAVKELLKRGADMYGTHGLNGMTALHTAARGHAEAVQALLAAGMDVNVRVGGDTALMAATAKWSKKVNSGSIDALLMGGADPNIRSNDGEAPLNALVRRAGSQAPAEKERLLPIIKGLVAAGADVSYRTPSDGRSIQDDIGDIARKDPDYARRIQEAISEGIELRTPGKRLNVTMNALASQANPNLQDVRLTEQSPAGTLPPSMNGAGGPSRAPLELHHRLPRELALVDERLMPAARSAIASAHKTDDQGWLRPPPLLGRPCLIRTSPRRP